MSTVKRITDLSAYTRVLPYDSELFGVYQPLIGWKSGRKVDRIHFGGLQEQGALIGRLSAYFKNRAPITFNADCAVSAPGLAPAGFLGPFARSDASVVVQQIADHLGHGKPPKDAADWRAAVNAATLAGALKAALDHYNQVSIDGCRQLTQLRGAGLRQAAARDALHADVAAALANEAEIAGAIEALVTEGAVEPLTTIFFSTPRLDAREAFRQALIRLDPTDPYLTFDPKRDVKDVSLSPLGIVHLFRQFFFELDSFLGTPSGHVWLSPGSTVELIEINTRRTLTEQTVESSTQTVQKSETATTDQDELSEAVKQDNRDDLKLGVSATVNQSWGTGSASATASLNLEKTQQVARETTHKRMRQQSSKLSSEITQNYKTTFKTVTETTDTSSKRYTLTNTTDKLINYELRRKMRQVAVQVQDVGSFLCWETFVDEPGQDLGLASLIHIAKPADLLPLPDTTQIPVPPDQMVSMQGNGVWNFDDSRQHGFVPVGVLAPPPAPDGMQIVVEPGVIPAVQISGSGDDFTGTWGFGARFLPTGQIQIGVITAPGGLSWDNRVDFVVGTAVRFTATDAKRNEIAAANAAKMAAGSAATAENDRKTREAFIQAAKDRIELASSITKRTFEDMRDEERIIIYRRLIDTLMTSFQYDYADDRTRHVLSELINSIFDTDKMLYFVAPEWWKPRQHARESLGLNDLQGQLGDSLVSWSDNRPRPDNYLITEKTAPAPEGASLGWLLQLDGDNLRNAFLNAPWVKAVIPVRPGKELAALAWLENAEVEGADGLDNEYSADAAELDAIRTALGLGAGAAVTLRDAIRYLCTLVSAKSDESNATKLYPSTEINDDDKVTSTPVEKVYEHGFYPLQGGFKVNPSDPDPDPNNTDKNFQVFDQWLEVLPTDQMVPVEVKYDPITGRQTPGA